MTKILPRRFKQCYGPFNMLTVHTCSDTGLFRHLSNPAFAVYNFGNKSRLRLKLFFKLFKIWWRVWKYRKKLAKYFWIWRQLHWNWFPQTLAFTEREYLSSDVNILTNSMKISDTTRKELFELIFLHSYQKIWQKCCLEDLSSVLEPSTSWMSKGVLTRGFLGI